MSLSYIHAQNYRCFRDLDVKFNPGINLLIGDNATGKTTVLELGQMVCSSLISGYHDEGFTFRGFDDCTPEDEPLDVTFTLFGVNGNIALRPERGTVSYKGLRAIMAYGQKLRNQVKELPVLAAFSTGAIHLGISEKVAESNTRHFHLKSDTLGYQNCFSQFSLIDYWTQNFLALEKEQKCLVELASVRKSIMLALGSEGMDIVKGIVIHKHSGGLHLILKDGREIPVRNLSDGYRRLLDIVMDIAFRCALLNAHVFGEDSGQKSSGIVFIDDIEFHLHPTLQERVFKGLQKAFPNIQFIATTHAPLVISSIPNTGSNQVIKLGYSPKTGYTQTLISGYGQDATAILGDIMDAPTMDTEVQSDFTVIRTLIDNRQTEQASAALEELRAKIGNTAEVTKLGIDISFAE